MKMKLIGLNETKYFPFYRIFNNGGGGGGGKGGSSEPLNPLWIHICS